MWGFLPMTAADQMRNGNGHAATEEAPQPAAEEPHAAESGGVELRQRLDQVGKILAKGLDLAEAGVSLGVTIVSRVGVAAQQKIREGLDVAAASASAQSPPDTEKPGEAAEREPEYGITNRLPLMPGGTVRISFSVNNDSTTEPKKVELRLDGFTGDASGRHIDPALFSVKPGQKAIAPVDFEKFVLQGSVPDKTPPDVYRGAIFVGPENELRIPVVLVVLPL